MFEGKGIMIWPDGRKYEGDFFKDNKHGFGIMEWSNGKKYEGLWFKGKQHGKGKIINIDGTS